MLRLDSVLLYSSTDHKSDASDESLADPNTYLPFKIVDTVVTKRIGEELDALAEEDDEGEPVISVWQRIVMLTDCIKPHVSWSEP